MEFFVRLGHINMFILSLRYSLPQLPFPSLAHTSLMQINLQTRQTDVLLFLLLLFLLLQDALPPGHPLAWHPGTQQLPQSAE